jgi:hypothetical protein
VIVRRNKGGAVAGPTSLGSRKQPVRPWQTLTQNSDFCCFGAMLPPLSESERVTKKPAVYGSPA